MDVETGQRHRLSPAAPRSSSRWCSTTRGRACSAIPYYGGNANFVGWDLLGYPGVRTMVTAADQKALEAGQLEAESQVGVRLRGVQQGDGARESHAQET